MSRAIEAIEAKVRRGREGGRALPRPPHCAVVSLIHVGGLYRRSGEPAHISDAFARSGERGMLRPLRGGALLW